MDERHLERRLALQRRYPMAIATALVGAAMLFLGRQFYWVFVGVAGFILGLTLASDLLLEEPMVAAAAAAVTAISGAVGAILMHKVAIDGAGFITSGYALLGFLNTFKLDVGELTWVVFLIGGVLGVLLVLASLQNALVFLSVLTATTLILESVQLSPTLEKVAYVGLVLIGLAIQMGIMQNSDEAQVRHA
jgi:hypothetical protein